MGIRNEPNTNGEPRVARDTLYPTISGQEVNPLRTAYRQTPIAVVGIANRLPGNSNSPGQLWNFLLKGGVAGNDPPESRFSLQGHYDRSHKPHTMRTPGAMFLENVDPADFDASFFSISSADATAMDPQQRQLLEVVYEAMENAGLTLEQVSGAPIGCFVGSYAVDYQDMQFRDPEDRVTGITVGAGRAILSNRISHFFNLKGPSMTIDTACSASMVGVDAAARHIHTGQAEGAIVAGANLYLSPDQNQDMGAMRHTSSATGKCHTFDAKADGYCKAEAINVVILKRLDAALRDGNPIRAIIRGTSTNSDGWTPGIASPSAEAQAEAIRAAHSAAGINDFNEIGYLECHGTGTLAGDPIEVSAAASVFGPSRAPDKPLIIGSIKSNIGHSEPGAGVSGLIKAVLATESGIIPGNPTFIDPNPKIDFEGLKVRATRTAIPWPEHLPERIASINSFGYGGSNAHAVIQDAQSFLTEKYTRKYISSLISDGSVGWDFFDDAPITYRHQILTFSANDDKSLKEGIRALKNHLLSPRTNIQLPDLAHTLSEKRGRLFNRGFLVTNTPSIDENLVVYGKKWVEPPKIGFVFTGQGAQWPQMGKSILSLFPSAKAMIQRLDDALQSLAKPPNWSLLDELVQKREPEHLRRPEFSQPLVTALQLAILEIFGHWNISACSAVGHSSGEIAAACAAGYVTPEEAIRIAFFRGQAAKDLEGHIRDNLGMMAVGLGPIEALKYIGNEIKLVQIACYNSPNSVTLSGTVPGLEKVKKRLQGDGHFARLLQVSLAYHSKFMNDIGDHYERLLAPYLSCTNRSSNVRMNSSVTGTLMVEKADAAYWKRNMISPVMFDQACHAMLTGPYSADFLIEIGPSGALAGPISQMQKINPTAPSVQYLSALKRGSDAALPMLEIAGHLFTAGGSVDLMQVNKDDATRATPRMLYDLPNYTWNHSTKYWHESDASKDWRFRPFVHHDLLGSKILGTPWQAPTFMKKLDLKDIPWLKDHKMGTDIIFPASGYLAMAMEAFFQCRQMTNPIEGCASVDQVGYRFRNVRYDKALVLNEATEEKVYLHLNKHPGTTKDSWYDFSVSSSLNGTNLEHCSGMINMDDSHDRMADTADLRPLRHPSKSALWYKAQLSIGYGFGPAFQQVISVESTAGQRNSRALVSLVPPDSKWSPQSTYSIHPACLDGCFQTVTPSLVAGDRSNINSVLVPAEIDSLVIKRVPSRPIKGLSVASSQYTGRGRNEENKNYMSSCSIYDPDTGALLMEMTNLSSTVWRPDISFLSPQRQHGLESGTSTSGIQYVLDLVAHKKPGLKVVEINASVHDTSCLWLESENQGLREACTQYSLVSSDPVTMLDVQNKHESRPNASFSVLDITTVQTLLPWADVDLLIVKQDVFSKSIIRSIAEKVRNILSDTGHIIFIEQGFKVIGSTLAESLNGHMKIHPSELTEILGVASLGNVQEIYCESVQSAFLVSASNAQSPMEATKSLAVASDRSDVLIFKHLRKAFVDAGWDLTTHTYPYEDMPSNSIVLVTDELASPVLSTVTEEEWRALKHLISRGGNLLWLTGGSQLSVTNSDNVLVHGLFRTIKAENPSANLATLDIGSGDTSAIYTAVYQVLQSIHASSPKTIQDSEFVERGGVLYVSRVVPDAHLNRFAEDDDFGAKPTERSLHDVEPVVMLRSERLGTLDSLVYSEVTEKEIPVKKGYVEVEILAAGLNFKDVAVTMGIVPENEYILGHEGAGVVRRVGESVSDYRVGDRVAVLKTGTFANRIQSPVERVHHIPSSMSFEDAATIPLVYLTAMYSLFDLGNLQRGQSVLIHSGAGGVGIAAIQLAQYIGAEVYVTVSSLEKRQFLSAAFSIPENRMFSSRTKAFATEIREITEGRGIDVIMNSLTGDLLDESWRLTADGGTMVEIGKKDIVDRNELSMEPFDRNCSFRAIDLSYKQFTDEMIHGVIKCFFKLIFEGHAGPIHPIKAFPFNDIAAAFAWMRSGKHIGKIVITKGPEERVRVPIRPAPRVLKLHTDASYLIVGGLKGLCGSLAVHMAKHGAKHIISMSRSGCSDERSQALVSACSALGCQVQEVKADVSDAKSVHQAFKNATRPIRGVVQGAMVLRDKPFETMTIEDYYTTISSKVGGTWNLHNAATSQGLNLDFFTLLSSISGVIGQKGQANYAAANVFMDNFAAYRKSLGLAATSIDLGVIEDVGYVAEQGGMESRFDKRQWTGINEAFLRKIISYSIFQQTAAPLNQDTSAQLITGIAVPLPDESELARDARFLGLFQVNGQASFKAAKGVGNGERDIQAFLLLRQSAAETRVLVDSAVEIVSKQFVKILRLGSPMELGKPLASYGLDSLSAVEFRNWVRSELGAEITLLEITDSSSLIALCEKIVTKIPVAA